MHLAAPRGYASGMQHVVSKPTPPFRSHSGALEVHQIPAAQDNLVWILVCTRTNAAAVVDGPDAEGALAYCAAHGIKLTHVLNTHTHFDHIGVNHDLARRGLLAGLQVIGPAGAKQEVPGITRAVEHGDRFELGAVSGRVLLTEGHIEGHVSFVLDDVVMCGDALFTAGCGRVFTGDHRAMLEGLLRLATLDPITRVCCAHEYTLDGLRFARSVEPENEALQERSREVAALREAGGCAVPSTIGEERATNPFLRSDSEALIAHVRAQAPEADLSTPLGVFTATRKLKDSGRYKQAKD
jgi:hydroxyacylglutathione hydrolase